MEAPQTEAEQILVCLSASPSNARVIQEADRIAHAYHAELTALYVETRVYKPTDALRHDQLERNLALARQCGAHIVTTSGHSVAEQIVLYAEAADVKKIVIGTHGGEKSHRPDVARRLLALASDRELFVIPDTDFRPGSKLNTQSAFSLRSMLITLGLLAAATLIGLGLYTLHFTETNIITVYLLSVLLTAYFTRGPRYGIAASVASVLVFNFFFTVPRFTLRAYESGYPVTFAVMLAAALLTSSLTAKVKAQAQLNAEKAYRTEVLLTASQNLQATDDEDEILNETAGQLHKLLSRPVLLAAVEDGKLGNPILAAENGGPPLQEESVDEMRVVLAQTPPPEQGLRKAGGYYLPVCVHGKPRAVAGILLHPGEMIGAFERSTMLALLGECGMALEKHRLWQAKQNLAMTAEQEKLRSNLLRSISHDLRTPLTSISGNADMLLSGKVRLSDGQRHELYQSIYEDSNWLIQLVENLLSITRMDGTAIAMSLRPELMDDVIEEAAAHVERRRRGHEIRLNPSEDLLFANMDASLIIQVLVNLLDNAIKYTPEGSTIMVGAQRQDTQVAVFVADDGPGIPDEAKKHVFDMFYTNGTLRSDGRRGLGLGLALCRAIVQAHGGEITVTDAVPHGAVFTFTLKREDAQPYDETAGSGRGGR
jgi:two-component system sensor histidine kinase KdpD